jgi:hypothetical protein
MDVATWQETFGVGKYAPVFVENDIDLALLGKLISEADLRELGVVSLDPARPLAVIAERASASREGLIEIDRTRIEERMDARGAPQDRLLVAGDRRRGDPKPLARDRVETAKSVVMMDLALLRAELANGM